MDKKTVLILGAGIVVLVLMVAIMAVVRGRGGDLIPSSPADITGQADEIGKQPPQSFQPDEVVKPSQAICGDQVCTPPETPLTCRYDCPSDLFSGITIRGSANEQVEITWVTSRPMSSEVEYRTFASGSFTRLSNDGLVTEHRIIIEDTSSDYFEIKVGGVDESGVKHVYGTFGHER